MKTARNKLPSRLRRALVNGNVGEATGLIERLQGETTEARSTWKALSRIVEGIQDVLNQNTPRGIAHLEQAVRVVGLNESLRWVALHWMVRAAVDQGQLTWAGRVAVENLGIAERLGPQSLSLSLLSLAELAALRGEHQQALPHLRRAIEVLKEVQDDRGAATALLGMARILYRMGRDGDAQVAAQNALQADPTWPGAAVLLSERSLAAGEVEQAIQFVAPLLGQTPCPPAAQRQHRLIEGMKSERYDARAVAEFLRLRDEPLNDEVVEEMIACHLRAPDLHQLGDLIAWSLYKLTRTEEAEARFNEMTSRALDPHLRASVSLGLACIASGRHEHPAARVRAASRSFPTLKMVPPEEEVIDALPAQLRTPAPAEVNRPSMDASPPSGGTNATFVGDLQLFALPDLLDFLHNSRRTGTLVTTSTFGAAAVHLINGRITGASAPGSTSLGDLLTEQGVLAPEDLEMALEKQQEIDPQLLLGSILAQLELVDRPTLEQALVDQVRMSLLEAVSWREGRFAFEPYTGSMKQFRDEIVIDLDTRAVLMDVLRQYDELCR